MFSVLPAVVVVYLPKPRSVTTLSSFSNREVSWPTMFEPRPSCGIALPVSAMEIYTAGMM